MCIHIHLHMCVCKCSLKVMNPFRENMGSYWVAKPSVSCLQAGRSRLNQGMSFHDGLVSIHGPGSPRLLDEYSQAWLLWHPRSGS